MNTLEDQPQLGSVAAVGLRPRASDTSIQKTYQESIDLAPGGVIGDNHYQLVIDDTNPRIKFRDLPSDIQEKVKTQGGQVIATAQVSLFEIEEEQRIKNFNEFKDLGTGLFGANIITQGIRLNEIRPHSIIEINSVRLEVTCRRSFCRRMLVDYETKPFWWVKRNLNVLGELRIGIMCQVLNSGTIRPGDTITVTPNPNLVGTAWQPLPVAGSVLNHWANRFKYIL